MVNKTVADKVICPHCKQAVKLGIKSFGQPSPPCPNCGEQILTWLEDYNVDFRVVGGTGAYRQGRKRFGGNKKYE